MRFFKKIIPLFMVLSMVWCGSVSGGDNLDAHRARIKRIALRVANVAGIEVNVVVVPEFAIDACVYPDGTIVITTGLINVSQSDDELAFVIGHEISHIMLRDYSIKPLPAILDNSGLPGHLSREIVADLKGMYLAEKAGYNPYASIKILTRIATDFDTFFEKRIESISHYLRNSSHFGME